MKRLLILAVLAGCASHPAPPVWESNAYGSLGAFTQAYLRGEAAIADLEFARGREEMASTGRPDLAARAELIRCAVHVASLDVDDCPGFAALAQDATPQERAYAAYLAGRWSETAPALLPEQHRPVVEKGAATAVADPLSRLVAVGALFRAGRATPADITAAVDTASGQGWRRPLLAWLGVQLKRAQSAGDTEAAARIQRRIDLVVPAQAGTPAPMQSN